MSSRANYQPPTLSEFSNGMVLGAIILVGVVVYFLVTNVYTFFNEWRMIFWPGGYIAAYYKLFFIAPAQSLEAMPDDPDNGRILFYLWFFIIAPIVYGSIYNVAISYGAPKGIGKIFIFGPLIFSLLAGLILIMYISAEALVSGDIFITNYLELFMEQGSDDDFEYTTYSKVMELFFIYYIVVLAIMGLPVYGVFHFLSGYLVELIGLDFVSNPEVLNNYGSEAHVLGGVLLALIAAFIFLVRFIVIFWSRTHVKSYSYMKSILVLPLSLCVLFNLIWGAWSLVKGAVAVL